MAPRQRHLPGHFFGLPSSSMKIPRGQSYSGLYLYWRRPEGQGFTPIFIPETVNKRLLERLGTLSTDDEYNTLAVLAEALVKECARFAKLPAIPPHNIDLQLAAIVASDLRLRIPAAVVRDRKAMAEFLGQHANDDLRDRQNSARVPLPCTMPQARVVARALRRSGVKCSEAMEQVGE